MADNARVQAVVDKFEIIEVSIDSLWCRDSGDWPGLAACFHPDARITTSWFEGNPREFAEQSGRMMSGHPSTDTQRHKMGNPRVRLRGHRAVCEFYVILYQGRTMDGYEFDFQTWSVNIDLFEKRNGDWRISKRMIVYEKDRMDPHVPGSVPQSYFDNLDLARYPQAIRFHCYRNEKGSGRAPSNLILKGSAEEKAARAEAAAWLAAGA
jgi:hypothetical protein